ncbi:hypothetical protein CABS01_09673 [Colletotrichum abscissum]|nr:uncharacterized protein CABS01_09673 [Colletotrichum abscissum]KAK1501942.1 hypothetical protein CABS01_09673 [Colletotrichum abscissum]
MLLGRTPAALPWPTAYGYFFFLLSKTQARLKLFRTCMTSFGRRHASQH